MKAKWLFPHKYRLIGWALFITSLCVGIAYMYTDFVFASLGTEHTSFGSLFGNNNLTDELAGLGVITGLLLLAFSKEQVEDEMIGRLRLDALQWSVYANYLILAVAILTIYDGAFLEVMVYNMFTVLLVFIGRFRWLLYCHTNTLLTL